MKNAYQSARVAGMVATSAALGAAAMYVFDPNKGRRRRAVFRDKTRRSLVQVAHLVRVSARDIGHRAQGFRAIARRLFNGNGTTDDLVLIERVRAKMGRVVSHPHAIQIGARNGRVTLSGPILPGEAPPLLATVRSVSGVTSVEDHLVVYDRPQSIPSLQGSGRRGRPDNAHHEWAPLWRILAVLGGGALVVCALRSQGAARIAFAAAGIGLTARGATNVSLSRLARPMRRHGTLRRDRMRAKALAQHLPREMAEEASPGTALH